MTCIVRRIEQALMGTVGMFCVVWALVLHIDGAKQEALLTMAIAVFCFVLATIYGSLED